MEIGLAPPAAAPRKRHELDDMSLTSTLRIHTYTRKTLRSQAITACLFAVEFSDVAQDEFNENQ